jgi:hypothetical protein
LDAHEPSIIARMSRRKMKIRSFMMGNGYHERAAFGKTAPTLTRDQCPNPDAGAPIVDGGEARAAIVGALTT